MGTRVLKCDNVGPSGELYDMVKELFNVLLLFCNVKTNLSSSSSLIYLSLLIFVS